ncbi:MAG: B12-binding domain-containing radical SAM protein [Candidatus Woesearchaeota archaeon]
MTRTLLLYPPFCTPVTPPFSITHIYAFIKINISKDDSVSVLDLNVLFHNMKFPEQKKYFRNFTSNLDMKEYELISSDFQKTSSQIYSKNNRDIVNGRKPELFSEIINSILERKPDYCAFSLVYSSQCFYAYSLIKELKKLGIKTVVGGPSVNQKIREIADYSLNNELELLDLVIGNKQDHDKINFNNSIDFSIYDKTDYFTPELVIPIKSSSTCYYKKCAFCTHHDKDCSYFEYSLENIKKTIVDSKEKHFFFIDDMIHKKRLLEIAQIIKPLNVSWMCQLRPTKDLDKKTLSVLHESGLKTILWGVESGNDRLLRLMQKGTNKKDIAKVLHDSHDAGIKNIAYIIFGFPKETKEELLETINFLKKNNESIDLVSVSMFGLQKGSDVYNNHEKYGVKILKETKRTVLDPVIDYETDSGLSIKDALKLRKKYSFEIDKINNYPKIMNYFREHYALLD